MLLLTLSVLKELMMLEIYRLMMNHFMNPLLGQHLYTEGPVKHLTP